MRIVTPMLGDGQPTMQCETIATETYGPPNSYPCGFTNSSTAAATCSAPFFTLALLALLGGMISYVLSRELCDQVKEDLRTEYATFDGMGRLSINLTEREVVVNMTPLFLQVAGWGLCFCSSPASPHGFSALVLSMRCLLTSMDWHS